MIDPAWFFRRLAELGVGFYTGVPDSLLKDVCSYITDHASADSHIIAANEGGAMAIGIGYHLATGKLPLVYMQNSGLGNVINPALSLADPRVYSVPALMMIGWRGEPGVKDEPQHAQQGRVTLSLLDAMEIPYEVLDLGLGEEDASARIEAMASRALGENRCCALVIKKNTFAPYAPQSLREYQRPLYREQAIELIAESLGERDIVVSTTGVASRELFEYRSRREQGHQRDFLTVGGMGHASQIALGIALFKRDRQVFCLDGDGALLMHMGGLAISAASGATNYRHIVFNNAAHDSVGGQPTVGDRIDVIAIGRGAGYAWVERAVEREQIARAMGEIREVDGPALLEIQVSKGFRKDLGRPTVTPVDNKGAFMEFVAGDF